MDQQHQGEKKNFESYTLIWLDKDVYQQLSTDNNLPTRQQLRSIINYLQIFDQIETCENSIRNIEKENEIILIVSGTYGKEILPKIHDFKQLRSIYIYCTNEQQHQDWTKQFSKIRGIFNNSDHLLTKLEDDQKLAYKCSSIPFTFFSRNKDQIKRLKQQKILTKQNGQFLWFQLLIESSSRQITNENERKQAKTDLVDELRRYFHGNETKAKLINDFEEKYQSDHALWWYTKEPFFYSVINKALRTYDYDTIILFRMFISDMYQSLKDYSNENDPIDSVYRGQAISQEEFDQIKQNQGELISFNNFLSTTKNRQKALFFADASGAQIHGLLAIVFQFDIQSKQNIKTYADISSLSQHEEEEEVLFMIGTICRIEEIFYDNSESKWIVRLIIIDESSYELHDVFQSLKKYKKTENNLIRLAHIFEYMGEYEKAETTIRRRLSQLTEEQLIDRYNCHDLLGTLANRNGQCHQAIEHHLQSIQLQEQANPIDFEQLAFTYNNLSMSYGMNGQFQEALANLFQSNEIKMNLYNNKNHLSLAATYDNIGNCYFHLNQFDEAQTNYQCAFDIRQLNQMPENSPEFIQYYMSLGNIFGKKSQLENAIIYHQKAIQIAEQVLPLDHFQLGVCYNNIGEDYAHQHQYRLARQNYQNSLNIYQETLPHDHPEIQRTQDNLDELMDILWTQAGQLLFIGILFMLPIALYIAWKE